MRTKTLMIFLTILLAIAFNLIIHLDADTIENNSKGKKRYVR
jgi:hypothetical protein